MNTTKKLGRELKFVQFKKIVQYSDLSVLFSIRGDLVTYLI